MKTETRAIKKFGRRLRELRQSKHWSQEYLAAELDVDRSYISGLELGSRNPTLKTIARISSIFRLSIAEFMAGAQI